MSVTGGFGMQFDFETGRMRSWYIDRRDGIKRWAENDLPVEKDRRTQQEASSDE